MYFEFSTELIFCAEQNQFHGKKLPKTCVHAEHPFRTLKGEICAH